MLHGYMRSLYLMTKRLNVAAYGSTNGLYIWFQLGHTWTHVKYKPNEERRKKSICIVRALTERFSLTVSSGKDILIFLL